MRRVRLKKVISLNHVRGEVLVARIRDDGTEDVPENRHIEYDFGANAWRDSYGGRYPSIKAPEEPQVPRPAPRENLPKNLRIVTRELVKMFPGDNMGLFRINGRVRRLVRVRGQVWRVAHRNQFFHLN